MWDPPEKIQTCQIYIAKLPKRCPTSPRRKTKLFSDPLLRKRTFWVRARMSITKIGHKTKFICHDHIIYQNFVVKLTFWTRYQQGWWNNNLPGARLMPQEVQSTCNRLITCKVYASKCANVIKYGDSRTCIFLLNTCTDFTTHIVNLQDGNIDRLHNFFQFASCNSNSFYILCFFLT